MTLRESLLRLRSADRASEDGGCGMRRSALLLAGLAAGWTLTAAAAAFAMPTSPGPNLQNDARPLASPIPRQTVRYDGPYAPGTIIISTPASGGSISSCPAIRRSNTASASAGPASPGRASPSSPTSANGRTGRRRRRCCCAGPTCRATWRAASKIRSARARCIWPARSTASTAPTSPTRSARRCPPAASA